MLNLVTARRKMIEGFAEEDIQAITCLTRFDNVLFAVQDTTFNIRFFRAERMVAANENTEMKKLIIYQIN